MLDWILILVIYTGGNGVSTVSIDFTTQERCSKAMHQVMSDISNVKAVCARR